MNSDIAQPVSPQTAKSKPAWVKVVAKYQKPVISASIWQIINSFVPYFVLTALAYWSLQVSYLLTLFIAVFAGAFLMRIFIIQHDCGHQSFFKSKQMNNLVGFICGIFTLTPYDFWRTSHAIHHATSGDLDFRGIGDVETKTVKEYLSANPTGRLGYRLYRNPFIMFGIGPLYMFLINQRTPLSWKVAKSEAGRRSLIYTDLILLGVFALMVAVFGLANVIKVQLPIFIVSSTVGVWLFYVQHNFEDTYWRLHPEWSYEEAAMYGSSYYKLPKILQWFSGNIGLHHIHHLSPKIPNYLLQTAYDENESLQESHILTLGSSIKIVASRLALWDEAQRKMVSFGYVHKHYMDGKQVKTSALAAQLEAAASAVKAAAGKANASVTGNA